MKNFLLGILSLILLQGGLCYYTYVNDYPQAKNVWKVLSVLQLEPVIHVVTKRCTNEIWDPSRNITARQWFQCNSVQNTISDLIYK